MTAGVVGCHVAVVPALWSVAFLGSTPLGGPVVGVLADWAGPRVALGVGAAACIIAADTVLLGRHPALRSPSRHGAAVPITGP